MPQPARDHLDTAHLEADLKGRSVRGGAFTLSAQFGRFLVGIVATVFLARLLTPDDFGLIAMVVGITNFLALFRDLGLSVATVQRKDITQAQVSALFWINAGLGILVAAVTAALAPAVAWFYDEPRLAMVTVVLALPFVAGGLGAQHQALLRRQMRFGSLGAMRVGSVVFGGVAAISAAAWGAGYWSLVYMHLATALFQIVALWALCGWRPGSPSGATEIGALLSFGGHLTVSNLLNYLARNVDDVLIGWQHGAASLGFYNKAYQLLLLPIRQFNGPLTSVAVPALSRLQDEPDRLRLFYRRGLELLTMVGMPLVAFCFVDADRVIGLVLGDQWDESVSLFRAMAPAAFLGTFSVAGGWLYVSLGRTDRQLRWTMFASAVTVAGFAIGLPWGAMGVALSFSVTQVALRPLAIWYACRGTPVSPTDVVAAIWRPALTACVAAAALYGLRVRVEGPDLHGFEMLLDLVVYGALYLIAWGLVPGGVRTVREAVGLVRELRG